MAKSRPEAPGTTTRGGVCTTMGQAFGANPSKGSQQTMRGPFDKPRAGGDNGLPTKLYDSTGGPSATPKAGFAASSPSQQGPKRAGQQ